MQAPCTSPPRRRNRSTSTGPAWLIDALKHASHFYYPPTAWTCLATTQTASAVILLCMRWPRGGLLTLVVQLALIVAVAVSIGATAPPWLMPVWSALLLASAALYHRPRTRPASARTPGC